MSERYERFELDGPARVSLRLPAGEAQFLAGDPGVVEVRLVGKDSVLGRFVVEARGSDVTIGPESGTSVRRWSAVDVEIRAGSYDEVRARLGAGDVRVIPSVGALSADAGAGDISVAEVTGAAKVKTASGDVRIDRVGGRLDVVAASGDVSIGTADEDVAVKTAAGDISITSAAGDVSVRSASGEITVDRFSGASFDAKTLAGDVRLGVVAARRFAVSFQSLSGDVRTDFPVSASEGDAPTSRLSAKTMSGDVIVRPAG